MYTSGQAYVKQFLVDNDISFVGLLETRVKEHKAHRISRALCKNWSWVFNYDSHHNGRIWVGWNPAIWNVDILFASAQVIHCKVQQKDNINFHFLVSFTYGMNSIAERRDLWRDLASISSSTSWCLMGDFNVIKSLDETDREDDSWDCGMEDFKECLHNVGVEDIRGFGPLFTWWNSQLNRPLNKKLDRALGNAAWFSMFPHALASYAPRGLSDHSPVILHPGITLAKSRKPFQFFNHLLLMDGFYDCVRDAWSSHVHGNPFFVFSTKLQRTRKALIAFNNPKGHISSLVKNVKSELHNIQTLLQSKPDDLGLLNEEKNCIFRLWNVLDKEEILLQQKSRATWLALGDRNTSFFSNVVKSRWNANKILSIKNSDGGLWSREC